MPTPLHNTAKPYGGPPATTKGEAITDIAEDIVRAERNPAAPTLLRALPTSRLQTVKNDQLMAAVSKLALGAVKFSLESRSRDGNDPSHGERLSVATPIHGGSSGDNFGMTVIEADGLKRVRERLTDLGTVDYEKRCWRRHHRADHQLRGENS